MKTTIINYNEISEDQSVTISSEEMWQPKKFSCSINTLEIVDEGTVHTYSLVEILDALVALGKKLKEVK